MAGTTLDKLHFVSSSYVGRSGFYENFYLYPEFVTISRSVLQLSESVDCIVVPCANVYGLKSGVPAEVQPLISDKLETNIRNHIHTYYFGEMPLGSAIIMPFPESVESGSSSPSTPTTESKSSSSKKDRSERDKERSESAAGSSKEKRSKRATTHPVPARYICWIATSRSPQNIAHDAAYNSTWSALLTIRSHNKSIPLASKDKSDKRQKLTTIAMFAPSWSSDGSDMSVVVQQVSLAVKTFMNPPPEPLDQESASRHNAQIAAGVHMTSQERERELEGLLWSRELESRGLCNEEELEILVGWVNKEGEGKRSHNVAAARALVALLRRADTEFTLRSDEICEKIISKTGGCLTRLLEMGHAGEIELHKEIQRTELQVCGKVGDGNAGSVYKAKYKGMDVAVKMFTKGSVSQDFIRELSMLSLIQHPLIVQCHGGCTKPGDEFIVEELMEASVYDLIHDKKFEMDMEMRLDFAISTAKCMNYLHSCGVIHRDLKSLNLLVSKNYQVKVCDFGLSRVVDSKSQMTSNIGTVSWVAPELFAKKIYTEKADVYSYGIILWELIARQMPFGDIEAFSVPLMVTRGERPDIPKDCPLEWKKLIKSCWHQKPTSRPTFKKILTKLRTMLATLREERTLKGDIISSDRGLFIRNSQFLNETENAGGNSTSEDVKGHTSSSAPFPSDSKSDSEYSSENLIIAIPSHFKDRDRRTVTASSEAH